MFAIRELAKRASRFSISSLMGFAVDNVVFTLVLFLVRDMVSVRRAAICIALAAARLTSALANYACNRWWVFNASTTRRHSFWRYASLVAVIAVLSYSGTSGLAYLFDLEGLEITAVKIAVEVVLFAFSYFAQRTWVFPK
ncbi:MAG: GtrA family protein [Kiritimatiellae bacterium]|nr:GtrA family protein [Kiritimatiellia bacterium]